MYYFKVKEVENIEGNSIVRVTFTTMEVEGFHNGQYLGTDIVSPKLLPFELGKFGTTTINYNVLDLKTLSKNMQTFEDLLNEIYEDKEKEKKLLAEEAEKTNRWKDEQIKEFKEAISNTRYL